MSRFKLDDKVLISGSIATRHRNRRATVVGVYPSRHTRPGVTSLDKYTVRFDDGNEFTFYDNQLIPHMDEGAAEVVN